MSLRKGIEMEQTQNTMYVALGESNGQNRSLLTWALQNSGGDKLCIIHVRPLWRVDRRPLKLREKFEELIDISISDKLKDVEKIYFEDDCVAKGILKVVRQHNIEKLVMGIAGFENYARRTMSKKSNYVRENAPRLCHIWFIWDGNLVYTREGLNSPKLVPGGNEGAGNRVPVKSIQSMNGSVSAETAERMYNEELRLRKKTQEELAAVKYKLMLSEAKQEELTKKNEELETMKNSLSRTSNELRKTVAQKKSLENQIEKSNISLKESERKIFAATELLQKYKKEHEELQMERDNALIEAEKLREQFAQGPSTSHAPAIISVFSYSDLEEATNYFDPSLKIGEGGFGSIYKGFLRHTQVAIKMHNPNGTQGPREFDQEVNVLSKLRHPNLVTLIGACPESFALVYEYLSGGSLEDRLICKDNAPPLLWHTRIRIATELCAALIFLHSSKPGCVIHGDLKPSNVLLDANFVCKLGDFGICRVASNAKTSMDETTFIFTNELKGTLMYMDPEFLSTGELTAKSDVYSYGIILLRLLTGKSALGRVKEVVNALSKGSLHRMLDASAGDWPYAQAEQLARLALRCCDINRRNRPNLETDVWSVLEPMRDSSQSSFRLAPDSQVPDYFMCPISQEIMEDPHIASDGFTYEEKAIRDWLKTGHDSSPMTNMTLANYNLTPNRALLSAIQEWLQYNRSG